MAALTTVLILAASVVYLARWLVSSMRLLAAYHEKASGILNDGATRVVVAMGVLTFDRRRFRSRRYYTGFV